jgi:hypothetical protein
MKWHVIWKSPELPAHARWPVRKRPREYESDVDAVIRTMLERDDIRQDQQVAWDRWWLNRDSLTSSAVDESEE